MIKNTLYLEKTDYINLCLLRLKIIDHVIVVKENCVYLIIHETQEGFVIYNGEACSLKKASQYVRNELGMICVEQLNIKVCCCYGQNQQAYFSMYTNIQSAFDNEDLLKYEIHFDCCIFSYINN